MIYIPHPHTGHTHEALQLSSLVPRLWPFLSHANRAVRRSCLQVLLSLLCNGRRERGGEGTGGGSEEGGSGKEEKMDTGDIGCLPWLAVILQGALCHLFQRLALEGDKSNADLTHQVSTLHIHVHVCISWGVIMIFYV